jgi:hypothetical protein
MDETYVHDLEVAVDRLINNNSTLKIEKEEAIKSLNQNQEYLKDVIYYLANKMRDSDKWQSLQDISKLDKKRIDHGNQDSELIVKYVSQRLGFAMKGVTN